MIYHLDRYPHLEIILTPSSRSDTLTNPFPITKPSVVIIMDANLVAIRQAEMFHFQTKGKVIQKVYFCSYKGSEQTNYETDLSREAEGFMKLIEGRKHVVFSNHWNKEYVFTLSTYKVK